VAVAVGVKVAVGVGVGVAATHGPGPAVLSTNPETVPLNWDELVEPLVVFTTMTKFDIPGTVNE
jgi:hypothetical protein